MCLRIVSLIAQQPSLFLDPDPHACMFSSRTLLRDIKKSGETHIVLDCSTKKIHTVLKQAQQEGMMTDYHNYLITSLVRI